MLKRHKNGFIGVIQEHGLDSQSFEVEEPVFDKVKAFVLRFRKSSMCFIVWPDEESFDRFQYSFTSFTPAFPSSGVRYSRDIDGVYESFSIWLKQDLALYIDNMLEPDFWEQITTQHDFLSSSGETEYEQFDEEEKAQLRLKIGEFRLLVINKFGLSPEQIEMINRRLDYMSEALDRLNRFDWRGVVINSVVSISIALYLNNEQGRTLFNLFKRVFATVVHLLQ